MRNIILLLFLLLSLAYQAKAQDEETEKTFYYQLSIDTPVKECDITGKLLDSNSKAAPKDAIMTKVGEKGDSVIVYFWKWKGGKGTPNFDKFNSDTCTLYFLISKKEFEEKAIPRYVRSGIPKFTIGTALLPIKLRFSPFTFSKDFTLGTMAGAKWRISRYRPHYFNLLGGVGITSATLDSTSTDGKVKQSSERTAFTISGAAMLEFDKVQIGFFVGWDWLSSKEPAWKYQGKTWISLGIGYTLLSRNSKNKKPEEGTNK